jgi:hypothetical protein
MSPKQQTKPLNITERRSTIHEFEDYCAAEKESRRNSGEAFAADTFDRAVEIALQKLTSLQHEGWT